MASTESEQFSDIRGSLFRGDGRRWGRLPVPLLAILGVVALLLGFWGFREYQQAVGGPDGFLDVLYLDLQLFTLRSGAVAEGPVPWSLQIARFLAPAVAGAALLMGIVVLFGEQIERLRIRMRRGHTVVCGLGSMGWRAVGVLLGSGRRVVVIERDGQNRRIWAARQRGALILVGDARDPGVLRRAGVEGASSLVSVCGDASVNAEVAARARDLVEARPGSTVAGLVHVDDPDLARSLRLRQISARERSQFSLDVFDPYERGARAVLSAHPPFDPSTPPDPQDGGGLLVVGLGRLGRHVVLEAARSWHAGRSDPAGLLRVTAVDRRAAEGVDTLRARHPGLDDVCRIDAHDLDVSSQGLEGVFASGEQPTIAYVGLGDDPATVSAALSVDSRLGPLGVSTVACVATPDGLCALVADDGRGGRETLVVFPLLEHVITEELLSGGTYEILARTLHAGYLAERRRRGETPDTNPSLVSWEALPASLRDSNRAAARDIGAKLAASGCVLVPLVDLDAAGFEFEPDELDELGRLEHRRWVEDNLRAGWRYHAGGKDAVRKLSPDLVSWEELTDEVREKDRAQVRELPKALAAAGYQIVRIEG